MPQRVRVVIVQPALPKYRVPVFRELAKRLPGAEHGQPVLSHPLPEVGGRHAPVFPQASDEFHGRTLGVQWEWNHNPVDSHWSLAERAGYLRLKALPADVGVADGIKLALKSLAK